LEIELYHLNVEKTYCSGNFLAPSLGEKDERAMTFMTDSQKAQIETIGSPNIFSRKLWISRQFGSMHPELSEVKCKQVTNNQ